MKRRWCACTTRRHIQFYNFGLDMTLTEAVCLFTRSETKGPPLSQDQEARATTHAQGHANQRPLLSWTNPGFTMVRQRLLLSDLSTMTGLDRHDETRVSTQAYCLQGSTRAYNPVLTIEYIAFGLRESAEGEPGRGSNGRRRPGGEQFLRRASASRHHYHNV